MKHILKFALEEICFRINQSLTPQYRKIKLIVTTFPAIARKVQNIKTIILNWAIFKH